MDILAPMGQPINQVVAGTQNQVQKQPIKQENTSKHSIIELMKNDSQYIPTVSEKAIIEAIEKANKKLEGADREFEFSIHEKTKQIMVKVVDVSTKEVVREIPSEKILDMVAARCESAGLFINEKV